MPAPGVEASSPSSLSVDPGLWSLSVGELGHAVLTFDHYPSPIEIGAIAAAGIEAHAYRALPMMTVRGTASQLRNLLGLAGLRSVVLDRPLDAAPEESARVVQVAASFATLGALGQQPGLGDESVAVIDIEGPLSDYTAPAPAEVIDDGGAGSTDIASLALLAAVFSAAGPLRARCARKRHS